MIQIITSIINHLAVTNCDPNRTFFGIPVWYKYLAKAQPGPCDFSGLRIWPPDDLPLLGAAIFDGILRVAAIVSLGFLMYSGALFLTSQGEPDKTKVALSTAINAVIGLIASIVAVALLSFLGNRLGG